MKEHRKALRCGPGFWACVLVLLAAAAAPAQEVKTSRGTVKRILGGEAGKAPGELAAEASGGAGGIYAEPRTYWLHLPPGYDGQTPLPLVVALHPRGGNGARFERITGFSDKADVAKFIVVYPSAAGNPRTWDAGYLSGQNTDADVVFLEALLDELQETLKVDPKRVYLAGMGSGAMMAYWAGARLSERIAAIGVISGAVGVARDNGEVAKLPAPAQPVSVVLFHGQHNMVVPYKGGRSLASQRHFLAVSDAVDFWKQANGCPEGEPKFDALATTSGPKMTEEELKKEVYSTEHQARVKVFRQVYGPCEGGTEVALYAIVDGNHKWPGARELRYRGQMTPKEVKATEQMWEFFSKHAKP